MIMGDGVISLNVAASGSADAAITWNQALTVNNDGKCGIGTASPARDVVIHGTSNATMQLTTDDTGEAAGDGTIFQQGGTNGVNCYIYNKKQVLLFGEQATLKECVLIHQEELV